MPCKIFVVYMIEFNEQKIMMLLTVAMQYSSKNCLLHDFSVQSRCPTIGELLHHARRLAMLKVMYTLTVDLF